MGKQSHQVRHNRTIVIDFNDQGTYFQLIEDRKAFLDFIIAFIMSLGFQLMHKDGCCGGFFLTRHSHYARARLNGLPIWRIQCTRCKAVFTVLPHFVLRYRKMNPDDAQKALVALHGGLSLELCALVCNISPMALYRLVCSIGQACLVSVLTRCGLCLPEYLLADEKHSHCLSEKVYLPTIVSGHVLWHLGYAEDKSASTFEQSYRQFQEDALGHDPLYRVWGILTDGFESTIKAMRKLFPAARIGNCMLHAAKKVPGKLQAIPSSLRRTLSHQFYTLFEESRQEKGLPVFCFGQKLRRFTERVTKVAGKFNGERIHQWISEKKAGWFALIEDLDMPTTSTVLDQIHNTIDRKLFMMKGFHHPDGSQRRFLNGFALLHDLIPYQRRAKHAGQCPVEVEGGKLPTKNWFLNLQIYTAGGFQ